METKDLTQTYILKASPQEIYDSLADMDLHADLTGAKATGQTKKGGSFTAYDGYIMGKFIDLLPGQKIVADWRGEEDSWPKGHFSRVTWTFNKKNKDTTEVTLNQRGVPVEVFENINQGWVDYYWKPLIRKFGQA
jgi:activator of HSP90 ATPase